MIKKSGVLTFIFSFVPGLGQMYLGYIKRGVSLMTMFFIMIGLIAQLNMQFLTFIVPVIIAYSFFDTWRLRNFPGCEADNYIISAKKIENNEFVKIALKRRKLFGVSSICVGLILCTNVVMRTLFNLFNFSWHSDIFNGIAASFVLVILGIVLLVKKPESFYDNSELGFDNFDMQSGAPQNFDVQTESAQNTYPQQTQITPQYMQTPVVDVVDESAKTADTNIEEENTQSAPLSEQVQEQISDSGDDKKGEEREYYDRV